MCGDTCEDEEGSRLTGKARVKPVEIMDQEWCQRKLMAIRKGKGTFEVAPKVYCVAYNESYHTKFFQQKGGEFEEVPPSKELFKLLERDDSFYIRATGSCKGDSGGPLYEKTGQGYTVIGTTSRGTGPIGNCGGRGNPTHYVMVKEFVPWMTNYVDKGEICITQ